MLFNASSNMLELELKVDKDKDTEAEATASDDRLVGLERAQASSLSASFCKTPSGQPILSRNQMP